VVLRPFYWKGLLVGGGVGVCVVGGVGGPGWLGVWGGLVFFFFFFFLFFLVLGLVRVVRWGVYVFRD